MDRVIYCKLHNVKYSKSDINVSKMLLNLIQIYLENTNTPVEIFDDRDYKKIHLGKAKKFLCREIKKYVENNAVFNNNFNQDFKISSKQISKLLKKKSKNISIYTTVIIYFLVQKILSANNQIKLISMSNDLGLDLESKTGEYFMQKTYIYLENIIRADGVDPSNKSLSSANYIIDCFHKIDEITGNVQGWYSNLKIEVEFNSPYSY